MADTLAQFLAKVSRGTAEASLEQLFEIFCLNSTESTLAKVDATRRKLSELGLALVPDITRGELNTSRRVLFPQVRTISAESCMDEIRQGEGGAVEFKSSLLFHHKRAAAQPHATPNDLKSESVLHESLKTIAAFLTSGGGVLYVGINNDGVPIGIHHDFGCMTSDTSKQNADSWQLILRTYVRDKFKDGENINDYLLCNVIEIDEKLVARIQVAPRNQLSFLSDGKNCSLYRRQGNQTVSVRMEEFEEFLETRKRSIQ